MPTPKRRRTKYPPTCVSCQRPLGRGSRPIPVFREDYRLLGKAHVTCARRNNLRCSEDAKTIIEAQFQLWANAEHTEPTPLNMDLCYAESLASVYGLIQPEPMVLRDELADRIGRDLAFSIAWQEAWPGDFGPERVAGIIDLYPRVIQRFYEAIGAPAVQAGA